ncbi:amidase [Xylaria arbuscula]|nr:amidase [Xylaria arbuscula]
MPPSKVLSTPQAQAQVAIAVRENSLPVGYKLESQLPRDVLNVMHIPRSSGLLTPWELDITESYDATALLELLATQKVSAVGVVDAFRRRAAIANDLTNCLTELIPDALDWAKAADDHLKNTGKTLGPLHGLPISFKEQISVAGRRTNASFVAWVERKSERHASVVASLRCLGAIPFARTTQPQAFMQLETVNNIYSKTLNPRNRLLTSSGSSGGEAALMAMQGSPMGIGGSIRGPAGLNGLWGFKPSTGRFSGSGVIVPWPGCDSIRGTLGPFAHSLRDIILLMETYSLSQPWVDDPTLLPWPVSAARGVIRNRPLRVGIMMTDGVVTPLPPVQVFMDEVVRGLRASPLIDVRPFTALRHGDAWRIISANYFEDGGSKIEELIAEGGEPVLPLTVWILEECKKNEQKTADTTQGRRQARDEFREAYNAHWKAAGIDVVIAPVAPGVANPHGTSKYWTYTAVWNLLDFPGIAFPASEMIGGYARPLEGIPYVPTNEIEEEIAKHYDPQIAQAMPVGLQIVAPRWMDDMCLAAAQVVEAALAA